jgi:6-phosphogluconate dehydrogenase
MDLGLVGLGKMGAGIARRLALAGHRVVGFDADASARGRFGDAGFDSVASAGQLVAALGSAPAVWLMVPAGPAVDETIAGLTESGTAPATLIDGGNSNYRDTLRRHQELEALGIGFVDVGTSGGIRGEKTGYCLTIGGDPEIVEALVPLFEALAPSPDRGWVHVGPPGAGHFVKMVHNGIEYGMMQALAEGFAILERRDDFRLDLAGIARVWNEGSVIRSWLLELAGSVFARNPSLEGVRSEVGDSGEGRWAVAEAIELDVAAPVITDALLARIQSRSPDGFGSRLLSALRHEFGGHDASLHDPSPED